MGDLLTHLVCFIVNLFILGMKDVKYAVLNMKLPNICNMNYSLAAPSSD